MGYVFISYRRDDSAPAAGRIYDAFVQAFGQSQVFKDVDSIKPGQAFETTIRESLEETTVVVAVIGRRWEGRRGFFRKPRIFDKLDWVRMELALAHTLKVPVVPALIDRLDHPTAKTLPQELKYIADLHTPMLRSDRWGDDIVALIREIEDTYGSELNPSKKSIHASNNRVQTGRRGSTADIYVCYRITDVPHIALRLIKELNQHFPDSVIDSSVEVANITKDQTRLILERVGGKSIVLVIIGDQWLTAQSASGDRCIEQQDDYVRLTIERALMESARILPIIVGDTRVPRQKDLPKSIAQISDHQAILLQSASSSELLRVIEILRLCRLQHSIPP